MDKYSTDFKKRKTNLGFIQAAPLPSEEELRSFYKNKYFQGLESTKSYSSDYVQEEIEWFRNEARVSEFIWSRFSGKSRGKLLDIGCGEGFFSNTFLENKWLIDACDFSSHGLKKHNPSVEKYFTQGDIYEILNKKMSEAKFDYDLINLSHVLEHVRTPKDLMLKISKIMTKKSLLRVRVPNDFSPFQEFLVKRGFTKETWFAPPDHLNYFNFDTFNLFIEEIGLRTEKILSAFPIEFYLTNKHSNYWKDRSLGKEAHHSKILIDNFLFSEGMDRYIDFYESLARVGMGRSIIAFLKV